MALRCDLIIRDATVFDGLGTPRFEADVAVTGDRIVAVGDLGNYEADRDVDADGKALAPGFIDAHTHDDRAVLCGPACMLCKMSQGVTTVVVGNCGISLSPVRMTSRPVPPLDLLGDETWFTFDSFGAYAERLARDPSPVNTYALIGHMSLRVEAMGGDTQRAATDREAAQMQVRLREALAQGASGLLDRAVLSAEHDGPDRRGDRGGRGVAAALAGCTSPTCAMRRTMCCCRSRRRLKIGRAVNVPVVISHHKCSMPENFGRSVETLPMIDQAAPRRRWTSTSIPMRRVRPC